MDGVLKLGTSTARDTPDIVLELDFCSGVKKGRHTHRMRHVNLEACTIFTPPSPGGPWLTK